MPVFRNHNLSPLERTLRYTWIPEIYVGSELTDMWMFYWFYFVCLIFLMIVLGSLLVTDSRGTIPIALELHYPTLLIGGAFWIVWLKAVSDYSKVWAAVYLPYCIYLIYDKSATFVLALTRMSAHRSFALHLAIGSILALLLEICFLLCTWHIVRMRPEDASLWGPQRPLRFFPRRALRSFTLVPIAIDLIKKGRLLTIILIAIGANGFLAVPSFLDSAGSDAWRHAVEDREACQKKVQQHQYSNVEVCFEVATTKSFHLFLIGASTLVLTPFVSGWFLRKGRMRSIRTLQEIQTIDRRPPILFLRAFREDRTFLPQPALWFLLKVLSIGQPARRVDEIILEEGSRYGPVVALADPSDARPVYGAARGQFDQETWQGAVAEIVEKAQLVVVHLDETESLRWELRFLSRSANHRRCLFLVPVRFASLERNAEIVKSALEILGHPSTIEDHESPAIGFFYTGDEITLIRSSSFSSLSYVAALRLFLRTHISVI